MRSLNLLFIFTALFISVAGFAQESEYSQYELDVILDPETRLLSGTQEITYYNNTDETLDEVLFFLFGNLGREPNPYVDVSLIDGAYPEGFDPSWTIIHSVSDASGQALDFNLETMPPSFQTFSLDDVIARIKLTQSLAPGASVKLTIEFETKFSHASNIDAIFYKNVFVWRFAWNPVAIPESMLVNSELILPNANYRVRITLPEDYVLAAGAERQTEESLEGGLRTVLLENDVPVRSVALAISQDFEVFTLNHGVATIDSYYLPGHESQARLAATYAGNQLDYYVKNFGEYGYLRLAIVDVPSPGTYGMAADGMILLGTDNYSLKDLMVPGLADRVLEWLVAHEVGHLWWGIGVGTDFNEENWLSEGMAQYLSISYFEDRHGAFGPNVLDHLGEGLLESFVKDEFGYFNLRQHNVEVAYLNVFLNRLDEAIIKKSEDVEFSNATALLTYQKGYLVNRALEGVIGREAMFETLRLMYERYNHEVASVELLQQTAEEVTGQDLDFFFNSWLYGDDFIDVAVNQFVSRETDTEGFETDVQLIKSGQARYPVTIRVTTEDGETVDQTWEADSEEGLLTFSTATPVVSVAVDPLEMMPDVDRYNNFQPRKLDVKFGEASLPLDAYSIRVDNTGISGRLGLKHFWGVTFVPRFEAAEDIETDDHDHDEETPAAFQILNGNDDHEDESERLLGDNRLYLDGVAAFGMFLDRGMSISGLLTMTDFDVEAPHPDPILEANLGLDWILFEHPSIGTPGKFWYDANNFRFSVGALGKLSDPLVYTGIDYRRSDELALAMTNTISLRAGVHESGAFARASWAGSKRTRIIHSMYADVLLKLGSGLESLPELMSFSLSELQGFTESFHGDMKAFGRLALVLPPVSDINFSLLNLAMLENVTLTAFAQGGQLWNRVHNTEFDMNHVKAEVGAQVKLDINLPLGLPLSISVGYAYPIMGADEDSIGQLFFGFGG